MHEPLDVLGDLDEQPEPRHFGHDPLHDGVERELLDELRPGVLHQLLHPERDAVVLGLAGEDDDVHHPALLEHFRGVVDLARPGDVGVVEHPLQAVLKLNERPVVGELAHPAHHLGPGHVLLLRRLPRVAHRLAHAEREPLVLGVHREDHRLDLLAHLQQLGGVRDALGPGELGDVHEALDPRLHLDEPPVGHEVDDLALDPGADRVALLRVLPGAREELLEPQRHLVRLPVHREHQDVQRLPDGEDVRGVADAPPGDVPDVEQPVDPAQVDERPEVGEVLDRPGAALAHRERFDERLSLQVLLPHEVVAVGDDDVLAGPADLEDDELERLADEAVEVGVPLEGGKRRRHERLDADVHHQAALHLADRAAVDDVPFLEVVDDPLPALLAVRLVLGEDDHALLILDVLHEHLDLVADGEGGHVAELRAGDGAFGLEADVHHDVLERQGDDAALDDLALGDDPQALRVQVGQRG